MAYLSRPRSNFEYVKKQKIQQISVIVIPPNCDRVGGFTYNNVLQEKIAKYLGVVKASLTHPAYSFHHDTATSTHVFFLPFQNLLS